MIQQVYIFIIIYCFRALQNKGIHSYHSSDFYGAYAIIYLFIQLGLLRVCLLLVSILLHVQPFMIPNERVESFCFSVFVFFLCFVKKREEFWSLVHSHLQYQWFRPDSMRSALEIPDLYCLISFILCISF